MDHPGKLILFSEGEERRERAQRASGRIPARRAAAPEPAPATHRWLPLIFIVCFLGFGGALATTFAQPVAPRIDLLPSDLRIALFQRTMSEVASVCTNRLALVGGELHDHCLSQAHFLGRFPECDASCRTTVSSVLPRSHR